LDFLTTHDAPLSITINGTPYSVPRFLNPALKRWAAERNRAFADQATADLSPEDKRRWLTFFQPPPIDVKRLLQESTTPEGAEYVVREQLKLAGVPDETVQQLLDRSDPIVIRNLAEELTLAAPASAKVDAQAGVTESADPLPSAPPPSEGGASTGAPSTPDSAPPTP
jgi:hypothetical protein